MPETGWIPPDARTPAVAQSAAEVFARMPNRVFATAGSNLAGTGAGLVALLWKSVETLIGKPLDPIVQQTDDCVSFGYAMAVTILSAVEIVLKGEREKWVAPVATEPIYAISRVEIGGGQLGNQGGSLGVWGADAIRKYGVLLRQKYPGHDLSKYSAQRAIDWGAPRRGLPNELEPLAKEHPVETTSLVTAWEQLRDSVANGYPVAICSSQGFEPMSGNRRDADGFAKPRGRWDHCVVVIGVDDEFKRPGGLILNSWPKNWIGGPKRHDQPDGSFWVDAAVLDRMLKVGDSFAVSGFKGFPNRNFDFRTDWPDI